MEESGNLVSIITPTYNHEEFIGKCIESVLGQSYPHWEQIIIDDGSTDDTERIVASYDDKRIKYVKQKNVGLYNLKETYNKALNLASGDLIAILEGDDFWPPQKLETQIRAFEDPEVGLCWGKAKMTDDKGNFVGTRPNNFEKYENLTRTELIEKLLHGNFIPACTVMCRKDSLVSIGGFQQPPNTPYVDYPTWLELSLNEKFLALDSVLGCWRRHSSQVSTSKALEMGYSRKYSLKFFKKLDPELKRSLGITMDELAHEYKYKIAIIFFYLAKRNLVNHEWKEGKYNFKKAFEDGNPSLKFKSLLGLLCAYSKINLYGITQYFGSSTDDYI